MNHHSHLSFNEYNNQSHYNNYDYYTYPVCYDMPHHYNIPSQFNSYGQSKNISHFSNPKSVNINAGKTHISNNANNYAFNKPLTSHSMFNPQPDKFKICPYCHWSSAVHHDYCYKFS